MTLSLSGNTLVENMKTLIKMISWIFALSSWKIHFLYLIFLIWIDRNNSTVERLRKWTCVEKVWNLTLCSLHHSVEKYLLSVYCMRHYVGYWGYVVKEDRHRVSFQSKMGKNHAPLCFSPYTPMFFQLLISVKPIDSKYIFSVR